MPILTKLHAREVIDSRAEPTIEVDIEFQDGSTGRAQAESGASIGSYEAHELRDGDMGRLQGRGVMSVVQNVNQYLAPQLMGIDFSSQRQFDQYLTGLDGTPNLEHFGANGILASSIAFSWAYAQSQKQLLFQSFGLPITQLPKPMFTIFNGGKLASFSTDVQEFNLVIKEAVAYHEALRMGSEIYHAVGQLLHDRGFHRKIGDEGGYAVPGATTDQGMQLILDGVEKAGYKPEQVGIVIDEAATNLFTDAQQYHLAHHDGDVPSEYLIKKFESLVERFPLMGIEDGLADLDWDGWKELTRRLGDKIMIIGDDIFSTNAVRLQKGFDDKVGNAVMIKPSQIGTLTGAIDAVEAAKKLGYSPILSHRSGDTESVYLAHVAVGLQIPYVKFGAPARGERVAKYNELLRIEELLQASAV